MPAQQRDRGWKDIAAEGFGAGGVVDRAAEFGHACCQQRCAHLQPLQELRPAIAEREVPEVGSICEQARELVAVEAGQACAKAQDALAQTGKVIAQRGGCALAVRATAGKQRVQVGRRRVAGVIDAIAVEVIALCGVYEAITGPIVDLLAAGAQTDAPLSVAHVERLVFDIAHRVFGIDIAAVAPQADVAPDLDPRFLRRFEQAQQRRVVETADNASDGRVDALGDFGIGIAAGAPVREGIAPGQLIRGAETRGVADGAFGHDGGQTDFVAQPRQEVGLVGGSFHAVAKPYQALLRHQLAPAGRTCATAYKTVVPARRWQSTGHWAVPMPRLMALHHSARVVWARDRCPNRCPCPRQAVPAHSSGAGRPRRRPRVRGQPGRRRR